MEISTCHGRRPLPAITDESITDESAPSPTSPELDELEQYLADPEKPPLGVKVLAWWKAKESKWPSLAKMVKQYFAAPASSAGVERIFSAAGKMHGDLQISTLEFLGAKLPCDMPCICLTLPPQFCVATHCMGRRGRWLAYREVYREVYLRCT